MTTESSPDRTHKAQPWLGIRFECCQVYYRVYRNAAGTAYVGRCPKCCRELNIRIGPGGTDARFFKAW